MDKREALEKALGQMMNWAALGPASREDLIYALAEQIMLPVKIRHTPSLTFIEYGEGLFWEAIRIRGHHGTPGKYLFIGVPLEEKDFEEFILTETEAAFDCGLIDEETGLPFDLEDEKN